MFEHMRETLEKLPSISAKALDPEKTYKFKLMRCLPREKGDILPDDRVRVLGKDNSGCLVVLSLLAEDESCCWRCTKIAVNKPELECCPHCGQDFND